MPSLLDLAADTAPSAHPGLPPVGNALDPSIALKGAFAQPGAGLGQVETWADVQNKMNQNKLFQQTFQAKQLAGQILAGSPDLETGLGRLYQDPRVAPFAGEIVSNIRQSMLAQTQNLGEQQKQATSGWEAIKPGLSAIAADPTEASWDAATKPVLATLSPSARKAVSGSLDSLRSSLFSDLPADPDQAKALVKTRVAGLLAGNPDAMGLLFGKPTTQDTGGSLIPGITSQTTGAFAPAGHVGKTLAPTVVKGQGPEGQDITTVWGGGNGLGGGIPARGGDGVARPLHADNPAVSAPARPPGNALIGPSQTASQYNLKRTDDVVDYEKSLDDRVNNGATLRKNIEATVQAARQASMGGGAEAYSKLGSALQALGVKNPTVDKWANGSLAASQVIDKVALQNSMSQLKQQLTGVGGSRLNAQEFVAYLNKNPNLTTDPRAAAEIFQLWNQFYDRDRTEQRAFDAFKRGQSTGDTSLDRQIFDRNDLSGGSAKPDLKRWPALWNQSDYMQHFAPGGTIDTSGVKGLPAGVPKDIQDIMNKHLKKK